MGLATVHKVIFSIAAVFILLMLGAIIWLSGSFVILSGNEYEALQSQAQQVSQTEQKLSAANTNYQDCTTKLSACGYNEQQYQALNRENEQNIKDYNNLVDQYNTLRSEYIDYSTQCQTSYNKVVKDANDYYKTVQKQYVDNVNTITGTYNQQYNNLYSQCRSLANQCQTMAYNYQACQQQLGQATSVQNVVSTAGQVLQLMSALGLV